jgi:hypothetical protein
MLLLLEIHICPRRGGGCALPEHIGSAALAFLEIFDLSSQIFLRFTELLLKPPQ